LVKEGPGYLQVGGGNKPSINVTNLKYLYTNERLMVNVAKIICYIYAASSLNKEKSDLSKDIEELLIHLSKTDKNNNLKFLNYFKTDNNFKIALSERSELYELLSKLYYETPLSKTDMLSEVGTDQRSQMNQLSENNCKQGVKDLDHLISDGGSFTRKEALFLEFCDKAFIRLFD